MPRQNLCIARRLYASLTIMYDEKTSCLVKIYASREEFMPRWNSCIAKIMHRGNHASRVINYARREDFMPRQNLYIARRFYTSQEFTYRGKIFMPRKRTYFDKKRAILILWPRLLSVISYKNKHHGEHRR